MSLPGLTETEKDGALGVLPPSSGDLCAFIGVSETGTLNTPATYGKAEDVLAAFGYGPLTEYACNHITLTGNPVLVIKCDHTTDGAMGTIDDALVTGTAKTFITHTASTEPLDDYQVIVKIVNGGTLGVAGITYQVSLDNGRNFGPVTALGTALIIAPARTGVSFTITTAKTLIAGDSWYARTSAPLPSSTNVTDAMQALKASIANWEQLTICCDVSATLHAAIETKFAELAPLGMYRYWLCNVRMPADGESEATYLSSVGGAFSALTTIVGGVAAGAALNTSSVPRRTNQYLRPALLAFSARQATVSRQINIAQIPLGALQSTSLRDANGNPQALCHDEMLNPGLDDARFITLRTWAKRPGVYVTRPRCLAPVGSDFTILPLRRVMNLARQTMRAYLEERMNSDVLVNPDTGFILEKEALEIEAGANGRLAAALGSAPMASGWSFVLSRTDNVLSTKTLTGDTRVIPLGYVENIVETIGFTNPALSIVTV